MPRGPFLSRRTVLAGASTALLAGCADQPLMQILKPLKNSVTSSPDNTFSRAAIERIPYATMIAKVGKGPEGIIVLAGVSEKEMTWVSADRALIATKNDRIIKTAGFPQNLKFCKNLSDDPLLHTQNIQGNEPPFRRLVDITPGDIFGMMITSRIEVLGRERITVIDQEIDCIHLAENCSTDRIEWEFTNEYWVDAANGTIWRSTQYYAPSSPPITLTIGKPYRAS